MASGKLVLYGYLDSAGRQHVYIKFSHKGVPAMVITPESIMPADLDQSKISQRKFEITGKNVRSINDRLAKLSFLCASVVEEFKYRPASSFTVADMKARCVELAEWKEVPAVEDESGYWLLGYNKWIEHRAKKEGASENTQRNYRSARTLFKSFLLLKKKENLNLFEITPELLNDWVDHMNANGTDHATIKKHISSMRLCCSFHKHPKIGKEWVPDRKLKIIKKQGVKFTVEEIKQLYNYQPSEFYQPVKDLLFRFIASGVRWSDQDINILQQQGEFVLKRNQKNQRLSSIPISKYLLEVLDKPKPEMSNSYFNKYVKLMCKAAGINRLVDKEKAPNGRITTEQVPLWSRVSSKIGRKSLVSLLAAAGFSRPEIKKIIGNETEIDAYEVVEHEELAKKLKTNFGGVLD